MSLPDPSSSFSRRSLLGSLGAGVVGGLAAGELLTYRGVDGSENHSTSAVESSMTMTKWLERRGQNYYIAHRGSGDVFPEHTTEAYEAAFQWGAQCMEISVGMTSDGVLVCMHDLTYDRTTNARGALLDQPSTILRSTRVIQPQLGPAWTEEPLPRVPLFEDVLRRWGGRAILCVEAKVDAAFPKMIAMVENLGLRDSVMVKAHHKSVRVVDAQQAGYPVFGYFGSAGETSISAVTEFGGRLNRERDCLVLPAYDKGVYIPDSLVRSAVQTGVPLWVFPLHRRVDADHYFGLGASGAICSSYGYVSTRNPVASRDTWESGAVASGEMTKIPGAPNWAPTWGSGGVLNLAVQDQQHFLTLGQFCPIGAAARNYIVDFEARFTALPSDRSSNVSLAFCHIDDAYYQHRLGVSDGYHAILRVDGRLELFNHRRGEKDGRQLGKTVPTAAPRPTDWMAFRLLVTPSTITWQRQGSQEIRVQDSLHRGGYLHIGRSGGDGILSLRALRLT